MTPLTFEEFAAERLTPLLRYAAALSGSTEQARDIVQEAMLHALRHWRRVAAMDSPNAYVKRIVTNEYLSWRRRWSVRTVTTLPGSDLDGIADSRADGQRVVDDRDQLRRWLAALPYRQRAAIVLRYYEGHSYAECAEILGCTEGTARSLCSRGIATLRQADGPIALTARREPT